jgi:ATP/maltotriose-dependent transcriptional regulator MalT
MRSLALYQEICDEQRVSWVRYLLAHLLLVWQRDMAQAHIYVEQSLAYFRQQGDTPYLVYPLGLSGLLHLEQGELVQARRLLEESLTLGKRTVVEIDAFEFRLGLARLSALEGNMSAARCLYQETLTLLQECQVYHEGIAASLEGLAALEAEQGESGDAARLWGAAQALRETIGAPMHPLLRASSEHTQAQMRAKLSAASWQRLWEEGRRSGSGLELIGKEQSRQPTPLSIRPTVPPPSSSAPARLTAREVEVLRYLAQGWTDTQIARHLVISPRTVNRHTTSLYSKLGVCSRSAATRSAMEHHLL